jgi:inhibitor of KinA
LVTSIKVEYFELIPIQVQARMNNFKPKTHRFQHASDQSLLVYFGDEISRQSNENVRKLLHLLETEPIPSVRNLHPAYCSLLVTFDALKLRHEKLQEILQTYLERIETVSRPEPRLVEIPVCYGGDFGPDLKDVADSNGISMERAIELHSSTEYLVHFLGFVPGFAYMGELPEELSAPRLPNPRKSVPPGSVGIAGNQTGVYPFATPGGWRLLGRTPIQMFRADRHDKSYLRIGDRVRFVPISPEQFAQWEQP